MLHRASVLTIACVATALGGCAATYPTYVMAPCQPPPASGTPSRAAAVEESELSSANEPRPRPRAASRATAARPDGGEAAPSQHPYYSPEWSKEQEREDEPLKRAVNNICRGC
jgi:hypothetical protein